MQRGELGTEANSRLIFIWEGAVASLPDKRSTYLLEHIKRRMGLFDEAVGHWEVHPWGLAAMWSLLARTQLRIDLCVTSRQPEFAQAVARKAERENWPVRYVFSETAQDLGRRLATMPDVKRVYYGLPEQRFAFGPHGYFFGPGVPLMGI